MSALAVLSRWVETLIECNSKTVGGLENTSSVQIKHFLPLRFGNWQNKMSTCKQMSKRLCLSLVSCLTRKTVVSRTKESGKVVQNNTTFPLAITLFQCRWRPCILHFSGVITVTIHSFSNTTYPFVICKMKWTADPLNTIKYKRQML